MPAAVVHWGTLLQVLWSSLLAGIGITVVFSLVIFASVRAGECSRDGRGGAALGFGALALSAFVLFGAGIVFGVQVLLAKG